MNLSGQLVIFLALQVALFKHCKMCIGVSLCTHFSAFSEFILIVKRKLQKYGCIQRWTICQLQVTTQVDVHLSKTQTSIMIEYTAILAWNFGYTLGHQVTLPYLVQKVGWKVYLASTIFLKKKPTCIIKAISATASIHQILSEIHWPARRSPVSARS